MLIVAGLRQGYYPEFCKDVKWLGRKRLHFLALMPGGKQRLSQYGYQGISLETPGLVQVINGYVWLIV